MRFFALRHVMGNLTTSKGEIMWKSRRFMEEVYDSKAIIYRIKKNGSVEYVGVADGKRNVLICSLQESRKADLSWRKKLIALSGKAKNLKTLLSEKTMT